MGDNPVHSGIFRQGKAFGPETPDHPGTIEGFDVDRIALVAAQHHQSAVLVDGIDKADMAAPAGPLAPPEHHNAAGHRFAQPDTLVPALIGPGGGRARRAETGLLKTGTDEAGTPGRLIIGEGQPGPFPHGQDFRIVPAPGNFPRAFERAGDHHPGWRFSIAC